MGVITLPEVCVISGWGSISSEYVTTIIIRQRNSQFNLIALKNKNNNANIGLIAVQLRVIHYSLYPLPTQTSDEDTGSAVIY